MKLTMAAVLAGLMLLGISTAFAVAGHEPTTSARPVLLRSSGGADQPDVSTPALSPSPSPSASASDDPIGVGTCAEDQSEPAEPQEAADEANEFNEAEDCPGPGVADGERHQRGPDAQIERGQRGDDGQRAADGREDGSGGRD